MSDRETEATTDYEDTCIICKIRELLGLGYDTPEIEVMDKLKKLTSRIEKPCVARGLDRFPCETNCPYGPLVEEYPGIPMGRGEALEMDEFNRELLAKGETCCGKPLDAEGRAALQEEVDSFVPEDYPDLPYAIVDVTCECFGCACPAFFPMQIAALKKVR